MFLLVITASTLLVSVLSKPQAPVPASPGHSDSTPIPIISQTEISNPDGSFKFSYETANGIKVEESGYLKDGAESSTDKIQVIEGSVNYTDSEGKLISLRYIADENGFRPEGDHLPVSPEAAHEVTNALKAAPPQIADFQAQPLITPIPAKVASQALEAQSSVQPSTQPAVQSSTQLSVEPSTQVSV